MGKVFADIDERNAEFMRRQHVFFVATAPLGADGRVNLSPKGLDSFAILDPNTVAYLDLTGSGIETVSHLRENGRITFLFCSFEGAPRLLRLYGRGEVIEPSDADWQDLIRHFAAYRSGRAIVRVRLERIADSCGYGVPQLRYVGERSQLLEWADRKGESGLRSYRRENNASSIDGLPGLRES